MQNVPQWILKLVQVEKLPCSGCRSAFQVDHLMSVGVQLSTEHPHKDTLTLGLYCPQCNEITFFEIKEMTLLDLAFEVLDNESSTKNGKPTRRKAPAKKTQSKTKGVKSNPSPKNKPTPTRSKSKISIKEVKDSAAYLKAVKTHEEFLAAMGMTPEEIAQYDYNGDNKPKREA